MKSFDGYLKLKLGNDYVLLAGGSHKALSDFSMSGHNHNDLYVSSLTTSGNYLRWVKNGSNNDITIPYATNADTVDSIHATGFLRWKGMLNIGNHAPFQAVVDIIKDTTKLNDGGLAMYSYAGDEYTVLIGSRNDATRHGNALKWGYANRYLWLLRMISGNPLSSDWEKIYAGYADSAGYATYASSYLANRQSIGASSQNHAEALKSYFDSYKSSIPRNCLTANYSSSYGNGSLYMGYFLSGYDNNPYGGFYVCHYNTPYYVGISNGSYSNQQIITSSSIGSQSVNYASSAGSVAWGNVTGKPFNWSGQSGQPTWLWGSNDGSNYYVWNPSNFSVNYASSAGNADTVDSLHGSNLVRFFLSPMTSGAPADSAKSWFTGTMPSASGAIVYNVPGSLKTIIAGKSSGAYGHMLQLNYDDNYLRLLRYQAGSWKSTDWEKISAGYADSAGDSAKIGGTAAADVFRYLGGTGNGNSLNGFSGSYGSYYINGASTNIPDNCSNGQFLCYHSGDTWGLIIIPLSSAGSLVWRGATTSTTNPTWRKVWDDANDGSGSGLDADLLDGQHGSYYAVATHTHSYLPLSGGTLYNGSMHSVHTLNATNGSADAWNKEGNALLRLCSNNNLMIISIGSPSNERHGIILVGHSETTRYASVVSNLSLNPLGGSVGIGTTSISYTLHVNGTCGASNFYTTSDRSKKTNIRLLSEHIRKFTLKETKEEAYGVIAQEIPEMFRDGKEGNMTVNYNSVLSYYIGLLENKVKELEKRLRQLENLNKCGYL